VNSVSTLPNPTSSRVSYLEWYLSLLSCTNHTHVIPDFIPSHALHFQSISSPLDPIYKILLLYPFLSSHHHLAKRSHLTTAVSSLLTSLWFAFMYFKTKVLTGTMLRTLRLALTRFLTPPISCSVVQGLAFLSNVWPSFPILCHTISPLNVVPTLHAFCSLKLITNSSKGPLYALFPFTRMQSPLSLLSSFFAQLTSTRPSNFSSVVLSSWTPLLTANPGTVETVSDFVFLGLQNHCRWWLQPWN